MADQKVIFGRVPDAVKNVRTLGSLIFDARSTLGANAYLDLTKWPNNVLLSRDLIAALYTHAAPAVIDTDLTIGSYKTTIKGFLIYCRELNLSDDFRLRNVTYDFLADYKSHLRVEYFNRKSDVRRRRFGNIVRLIQAAQKIDLSNVEFAPPRNFKFIDDADRTQPYSATETISLEEICRKEIRTINDRLEAGQSLLASGEDPRGKNLSIVLQNGSKVRPHPSELKWNKLSNLLWYVHHVLEGKYLPRPELLRQKHSSFNNSIMGVFGGAYRKPDVYSHLYPLLDDLIPFIILLLKKTGRNESSILFLRRNCIKELDGKFQFWYPKNRGADRLYMKYIESDGQFSPVSLIKRILEITAPLVKLAPDEFKEFLFLGMTFDVRKNPSGVNPLDPSYMKYLMNRTEGWCERTELFDDHGRQFVLSARRLRTTYLTNRYKKHGQLSRVTRDAAHALMSTSVPYVENESTREIHVIAIRNGINSARDLARPTVIADENVATASALLNVPTKVAGAILKGEQDVFFAACRDFFNQPGGKANSPCPAPWSCLTCSNAVITRHILPRVCAFINFMTEQRARLNIDEWELKFLTPWTIIHKEILPKFDENTIAEARKLAGNGVLYLPIPLKA
jgi:hypothetical protein